MTERTKRIRAAVEALRALNESDWVLIDKVLNSKKILTLSTDSEREKKIMEFFKDFGIPAHFIGYKYLKSAINYMIENRDCKVTITKDIYPYIAEQFQATPSRVERGIRTAIEAAWERGNRELHYEIFGYSIKDNVKKPVNFETITILAEYIRLNIL